MRSIRIAHLDVFLIAALASFITVIFSFALDWTSWISLQLTVHDIVLPEFFDSEEKMRIPTAHIRPPETQRLIEKDQWLLNELEEYKKLHDAAMRGEGPQLFARCDIGHGWGTYRPFIRV